MDLPGSAEDKLVGVCQARTFPITPPGPTFESAEHCWASVIIGTSNAQTMIVTLQLALFASDANRVEIEYPIAVCVARPTAPDYSPHRCFRSRSAACLPLLLITAEIANRTKFRILVKKKC